MKICAIICDIDGTLALRGERSPYDLTTVGNDTLNKYVAYAVATIQDAQNFDLILMSGRSEDSRTYTEKWLKKHGIMYDLLLMRPTGDNRSDVILKQELYETHLKDKYRVMAVFDDRLGVCRMWYALGLPLFRVGDPDATF